jgi:putative tryptophan/tyrosine transport system substrate-binding protein
VTGLTMVAGLMEPKRLEILHELLPGVRLIYLLANPNNAGVAQDLPNILHAAGPLGIQLEVVKASTENEIDAAFSIVTRERAQALMVMNDAFLQLRRPLARVRRSGRVDQLWASIRETFRQSGIYIGQILKGARPAELPIQQPTKFEMVLNLTTAKIIGLEVPPSLLIRADEVIE